MKTMFAQLIAVLFLTAVVKNTCYSQIIDLDESTACVVSDVSGKVTYKEKGNDTVKPVTTGTVLPDDATVMVNKKSSITLANKDRSLFVDKKGTYQMTALTQEVQEKGEVSRFAAMAFAAKGYATTPPDTTKKAKGWGDKDSIIFYMPIGGKIPLQTTTFRWTPLKDKSVYKLVIYQTSKDAPILSTSTSVASFTFDPTQLSLKVGQTCHAQVLLENDNKIASAVINFTFVTADQVEAVLSTLKNDKEYMKGSAMVKSLMEAAVYESQQLISLASERYQKAIKMDANNSMPKQMYVAFLSRIDK